MCRQCGKIIDAQVIFRDGGVYMRSICPGHGVSEIRIAASAEWYLKVINSRQISDRPTGFSREINKGCPHDCGLCTWHEKACNIPIISITNACNLKCPVCFAYDRDDPEYFMPAAEFKAAVDWIIESESYIDLVNITGGEPTLHPQLFTLLDICKRPEIGVITLNSNGLKLAGDEGLVKKLAGYGVNVMLSFNTFSGKIAKKMHGEDVLKDKLKALENLEKYGVRTTLSNLAVKDLNDKEIGPVIDFALKKDFIRNVTIRHVTGAMTMDEVINSIVTQRKKRFTRDDFFPLPGSHPLCYSICYLLRDGDYTFPFKRLFSDDEYYDVLGKKYLLRPGEDFHRLLSDKIKKIPAEKDKYARPGRILRTMKKMLSLLYPTGEPVSPFERRERAEKFLTSITIHSYMDEDTFDVSRIVRCGELVPGKNKTYIPACSYHLFYRGKDIR
jgi:uncharacterized radical SAM superfamily Fe-S cluster-containing enzyme